jgi:hypothetical protein
MASGWLRADHPDICRSTNLHVSAVREAHIGDNVPSGPAEQSSLRYGSIRRTFLFSCGFESDMGLDMGTYLFAASVWILGQR